MKPGTARALTALVMVAGLGGALAQLAGGCQQSPTLVPVRSLQRSGKASFVCLAAPGSDPLELPLSNCTAEQFTSECQYLYQDDAGDIDAGSGALPHLYALVTQTTTGEVAVIDTSALSGSVLDENPLEPGANFLHVGAQPTGIVSTPAGVATFVGSADIGHAGVFAIPSSQIRPASTAGIPDICIGGGGDGGTAEAPALTSWPACSLPSAPGDILLVNDPAHLDGSERESCDGSYVAVDPTLDPISSKENAQLTQHGRPKLVIAMPDLGGIAVVDAQDVFNRTAGSFDACTVERWVKLEFSEGDCTAVAGQPAPLTGKACGNAAPGTPRLDCRHPENYPVRPGGLSYANGKLYVADLSAPVIHVVDMDTPCNPVVRASLLPTSADNPARVVFASKVTASPLITPDYKQYLYATDIQGASAMVFDVSVGSTTRRPLQRQHPEWNPFQPRDRVQFAAPPADILLVQRDVPVPDPITGVAQGGVLCNPDPGAVSCLTVSHQCDVGTNYRTSSDFTTGAGPQKLRGEFAFAALSNGKVAVIDVADFDQPCRTPVSGSALAGCGASAAGPFVSSDELSCNIVAPNEARAAFYDAVGTATGNHVPGLQTFPLLYSSDGSVVGPTSTLTPARMVATLPHVEPRGAGRVETIPAACTQPCDPNQCGNTCDTLPGCPLQVFVGGQLTPLDVQAGVCSTACAPNGAICQRDADCCGDPSDSTDVGLCTNGLCTSKHCRTDGAACDPSVPPLCCSGTCSAGFCEAGTPSLSFVPGAIGQNNAVALNLEDPRAQVVDQNWTVTYEGVIPGFEQRLATLQWTTPQTATLTDLSTSSRFCDSGVLSENAVTEMLAAQSATQPKGVSATAADLADYVQITSALPDVLDPYWNNGLRLVDAGVASPACSYATCLDLFGTTDVPELDTRRDLRITEAFQDRIKVEVRDTQSQPCLADTTDCSTAPTACCSGKDQCGSTGTCGPTITFATINCCFGGATAAPDTRGTATVHFTVRVGSQWDVVGDQSGFLHHVVADSAQGADGVCRNACDPVFSRRNGRVVESPQPALPAAILDRNPEDIDPSPAFMNPMFRFGIAAGKLACATDGDCAAGNGCKQSVCTRKVYDLAATCSPTQACSAGGLCDRGAMSVAMNGTCFHFGAPQVVTARDHVFRFSTNGSFSPLLVALSTDPTVLVTPQAISYLAATSELAVTDGSLNGLIFVSLATPGVSRSYF